MKRHVAIAMLGLILAGCGTLLPQKREESSATKSAGDIQTAQSQSFERVTRGTPPPSVTVSGASNTVTLTYESKPRLSGGATVDASGLGTVATEAFSEAVKAVSGSTTDATQVDSAKSKLAVSIPLAVSLVLLGLALLLILAGCVGFLLFWRHLKNSNLALKAASDFAERKAAAAITSAESSFDSLLSHENDMALTTVDDKSRARSLQRKAKLEAERAKLLAIKPPPTP